ncbi:MAG: LacI family transcriptional regulator, partial [Spirochaetales bacterium]
MINAKKIAELAQVSRSTVQRALANNPNIAPETKDRILEIAASMEYRPNRHAKALVMRQQKLTYGVVFSVPENRFYQEVLKGIYQARDEIKDFGVQIDVQFMETIDGCRQAELLNRMVA